MLVATTKGQTSIYLSRFHGKRACTESFSNVQDKPDKEGESKDRKHHHKKKKEKKEKPDKDPDQATTEADQPAAKVERL